MYTKSLIQQQIEQTENNSMVYEDINSRMDEVIIEDGVFASCGNRGVEMTAGYFVEVQSYDTLKECVYNMHSGQGVRILENKKFILGDIYSQLSNCPKGVQVFDIEFLENIR